MPSALVFSLAAALLCELSHRAMSNWSAGGNVELSPLVLLLPAAGSVPTWCWTNPIFTGFGIPPRHGWGTKPALPKPPWVNSLSFSPGLAATVTILTQDQAPSSEICCTYTLVCVGDLPAPAICRTWLLKTTGFLAQHHCLPQCKHCELLASVAGIRANFQSRSDLGFLSKPICSWLRVIPTTFIAGWDNELLNPQISTTWSSFNSLRLQNGKAATTSCVHQAAQSEEDF